VKPSSIIGPGIEPAEAAVDLVSVIIPCYKQAHFLGEAIESVLAQRYPHVEIIVVDDGSPDDTEHVAARYPGGRYVRQENQGLSAARNTGLRESRGAFLVFLDADDLLLPGALEAGLNALRMHPQAAFVSGHYRYVKSDGSLLREHPAARIEDDPYLALLRGNYIGMNATVMYRRDVLVSVGGFDPSLRACEDYDLYLRIAREYRVYCHDRVVAAYRMHEANMSADAELMLKTVRAVHRAQWDHARANKRSKKAFRQGRVSWQIFYGNAIYTQLVQGQQRTAIRGLFTLLRYAPRYCIRALGRRVLGIGYTLLSTVLPGPAARLRARLLGLTDTPSAGSVDWGDLRRLHPLSRDFGFERGTPVDRFYIERFLLEHQQDIQGRTLEIGDNTYTRRFGQDRVTRSDVLHVHEGNPQATIVADLEDPLSAEALPAQAFDCLIVTQTLQLIYDVAGALQRLHRMLKPGGVLLATVPGVSSLSRDAWSAQWYWSFTGLSVARLFEGVFGAGAVEVAVYGNVLVSVAFLEGMVVEELTLEELGCRDGQYPLVITVRAVKGDDVL